MSKVQSRASVPLFLGLWTLDMGLWTFTEPRGQLSNRHGADFNERLAGNSDCAGLGIDALALARPTGQDTHVLFELQASRPGRGFLEAAHELRHDPFPLAAVLPDAAAALFP